MFLCNIMPGNLCNSKEERVKNFNSVGPHARFFFVHFTSLN